MQNTVTLLDEAKKKAGISSDYALANSLGVSRQLLSNWRHNRDLPNTLGAVKLAEVLGRNPIEVIAEIEIERAERMSRPAEADKWRVILAKTSTGFAGLFMVGTLLLAPPPANASSASPMKPVISGDNPMYIMSTCGSEPKRH